MLKLSGIFTLFLFNDSDFLSTNVWKYKFKYFGFLLVVFSFKVKTAWIIEKNIDIQEYDLSIWDIKKFNSSVNRKLVIALFGIFFYFNWYFFSSNLSNWLGCYLFTKSQNFFINILFKPTTWKQNKQNLIKDWLLKIVINYLAIILIIELTSFLNSFLRNLIVKFWVSISIPNIISDLFFVF